MNADLNLSGVPFAVTFAVSIAQDGLSSVDPRSHASFAGALQLFSSVGLVSATVSVAVAPAATGYLCCSWVGYNFTPSDSAECSTSPYFLHTFLASDARPNMAFTLPASHTFGREIVGPNLGRPSPKLVFWAQNLPSTARSAGIAHITVRCVGRFAEAQPLINSVSVPATLAANAVSGDDD